MQLSVVEFTTGQPGSGKSYRRCAHFLVHEFFNPKEPTSTKFWSNFPVKFDELCQVVKDLHGVERDEVEARLFTFPKEEVDRWQGRAKKVIVDGEEKIVGPGPWDYFAEIDEDLSETHIAIDEIHNFCPQGDKGTNEVWAKWLGEIRHEGATIEFLTQHPSKVGKSISSHAGVRRELVKSESRRDPIFKIPLGDWYNFRTLFFIPYRPAVWQVEMREVLGKWEISDSKPFWFNPKLFKVYDSYSASNATGRAGQASKQPYERMSKVGLFFWFVRRNGLRFFFNPLLPRVLIVCALVYACSNFKAFLNFVTPESAKHHVAAINGEETEQGSGPDPEADSPADRVEVGFSFDELQKNFELQQEKAIKELYIDEVVDYVAESHAVNAVVGMLGGLDPVVIYATGQRATVGDEVRSYDGRTTRTIEAISYDSREVTYVGGDVDTFRPNFGMLKRLSEAYDRKADIRASLHRGSEEAARKEGGLLRK